MGAAAERKTAELFSNPATIRALLEGAAEAILAVDREGRIVLCNRMAQAMFGYSHDELLGLPFQKLAPERIQGEYAAQWAGCFARLRSQSPEQHEIGGLRKDGTEFPMQVRLSVLDTGDGPLGLAFLTDITARRQAEEALQQREKDLRALTGRLISAGEDSKKQLARDLHDALSQRLALLCIEVNALEEDAGRSAPHLRGRLGSLCAQVLRLVTDVHHISRSLHPSILADLGLAAALEDECFAFSKLHGIHTNFRSSSIPKAIPQDVSVALYRISQEALRNIAKHAKSKKVRVSLEYDSGEIVLRIEDDGIGFDMETGRRRGGLGLISIQERARLVNGAVSIKSQPGKGTVLIIRVPLKRGEE